MVWTQWDDMDAGIPFIWRCAWSLGNKISGFKGWCSRKSRPAGMVKAVKIPF